ncbi:hypothetical protein Tco_1176932 [Tanacetum coccineum]
MTSHSGDVALNGAICSSLRNIRVILFSIHSDDGNLPVSTSNSTAVEVKEEFDKLVKQVELFAPINFEATKDSLKRFGEELQTKTSKRLKSDEAKDDEPTKKTGKRRKQMARKELHTDLDKDDYEDSDKASEQDDSVSGTKIPINHVPVAMKSPSIATYKIIKQGEKGVYQIVREDGTDIVYIVSRAKNLEKSHDLWLCSTTYGFIFQNHIFLCEQPSYVVVYEDEYQQDDVHTNSEDPLASVMLLLAEPLLKNFTQQIIVFAFHPKTKNHSNHSRITREYSKAENSGNLEISLNVRDTEDTLDDASKSQQKVYENMNDKIAVANKQNC